MIGKRGIVAGMMAAVVTRMLPVDCLEFARPVLKAHDNDAMAKAAQSRSIRQTSSTPAWPSTPG